MCKLVVISGCAGGGKSTLLAELKSKGYFVVNEAARSIVKEQIDTKGDAVPWKDLKKYCELVMERTIADYHSAKEAAKAAQHEVVFFDRSLLDVISYYQTLETKTLNKYDRFIKELRYHPSVFITPPWEEIFCQDKERQFSFKEATQLYEPLLKFYAQAGYSLLEIPRAEVEVRIQFVIDSLEASCKNKPKI